MSDREAMIEKRPDLRDIIERGLKDYRMQFSVDEDGDALPLVDALTPPLDSDIKHGLEELHLLADILAVTVHDAGYSIAASVAAEAVKAERERICSDPPLSCCVGDVIAHRKHTEECFSHQQKHGKYLDGSTGDHPFTRQQEEK